MVMLALFSMLMSWRLTGVPLHEWISLTLTALIVSHLLVHWSWVEGRIANLRRPTGRRVGGLLLNATVFAAMGTTIVSGFVVSKVVLPNHLSPERYLRWHGLHETVATFTLLLLGLHLAYNWDRIRSALRRPTATSRRFSLREFSLRVTLRRLAWIAASVALLSGFVWAMVRVLPGQERIMFVHSDGRRELVAPPPELTTLRPGQDHGDLGFGTPKLVFSLVVLAAVTGIGRQLAVRRRLLRPSRS
jgi:hypothetical protein